MLKNIITLFQYKDLIVALVVRVARLSFLLAHAIASNPTPPAYTEEGKVMLREMLGAGSPF